MPLKVLIAPCAYKGTLTASALADALAKGVAQFDAGALIEKVPIADGGDGTIESIRTALGGTLHSLRACGPLSEEVDAHWLEVNNAAVAELADVSGLALMPDGELNAFAAHTFGLGQVIADIHRSQPQRVYICVGGSASTDGGAGVLVALGARLLDANGDPVGLGNRSLQSVHSCDLRRLLPFQAEIKIAVDVNNPLLGENGAAAVYGPQKGARPQDIDAMDDNLRVFADALEGASGRRVREVSGAGAAGGTAFGIAAAYGAQMISGFQWLSELVDLEGKIQDSDLVITGEGRLDSQSIQGKAIGELARLCHKNGKPLWAVPALAEDVDWQQHHLHAVIPSSVNQSIADAEAVRHAVYNALIQRLNQ